MSHFPAGCAAAHLIHPRTRQAHCRYCLWRGRGPRADAGGTDRRLIVGDRGVASRLWGPLGIITYPHLEA
jgi:hypothetical protein